MVDAESEKPSAALVFGRTFERAVVAVVRANGLAVFVEGGAPLLVVVVVVVDVVDIV